MKLEIRLLRIIGAMATHSTMQMPHTQKIIIFLWISGLTIWANILNGFSDSEILPSG